MAAPAKPILTARGPYRISLRERPARSDEQHILKINPRCRFRLRQRQYSCYYYDTVRYGDID
jgi:hypothetical protein